MRSHRQPRARLCEAPIPPSFHFVPHRRRLPRLIVQRSLFLHFLFYLPSTPANHNNSIGTRRILYRPGPEHLKAYRNLYLLQHTNSPLNLTYAQWPPRSVPLCCRASFWPSALPWLCALSTPRPPAPFFLHCPRSSRALVRDDYPPGYLPRLTQANSQRCCHCPRPILRPR